MSWVLDLDGVVWLADTPIPGAAEAVDKLRDEGRRVMFVTNNSSLTVGDYVAKLARMGIEVPAGDVVSSALAAAGMVEPGSSALVVGGAGAVEALEQRGVDVRPEPPVDAVVVGFTREFDFDRLTLAARAVWAGARLIGTNPDATYPTPDGLLPGAGSLVAAVAYATGRQAELAGKPHQPLVDLLHRLSPDIEIVVGDRIDTDGELAARVGVPFGLVLSGVTRPGDPRLDAADRVADDLLSLVDGYGH